MALRHFLSHSLPLILALLCQYGHFSIPVNALLFHSTLLQHLLCTLLFNTALPIWCYSFPGSCSPVSSKYIILPFKPPFTFTASWHLITSLLDITNWVKHRCNSISSTCQLRRISNYNEPQQLLCTVDELCVPAFVSPDEMGEVVDDIDSMFKWYHLIS